MSAVIDTALEYATLGWHVLPGLDKRPFVKWAEATTDTDTIVRFWERWPEAEILVLCGPSHLAVLDVDLYKDIWIDMPMLPFTWVAETPRGGMQYIFADPDGIVPTTAGKLHPAVDTRGVGGLIVAPSPNSPKRKWVEKAARPAVWPSADFPTLGTATVRPTQHMDEQGTLWTPVDASGERMPNERCPGSTHINGDQTPSLGIRKMPDGTFRTMCWAGCDYEEVKRLLVEEGRYTPEELGLAPERARLFIGRDELMALEPPTWMIDPYLQENALIMLAAKFNTGKTFVAVNWAAELSLVPEKKVLYVALEGLNGLQSRIRAWEEHHAQSIGNLLFSPRGYSLNLLSEAGVARFVRDVEEEGPFDLVVIDNLGEAMPGDENDSETVARSMHALNQIRHSGGGAVLDLHNSGHGGTVRARGHSKMLDVHDTVVYLETIEGSIHGLKVISGKERNAERFVTRRAQLKPVADSLVAVMGGKAVAEADPTYNAIRLGHDTVNKLAKYLDIHYNTARDRVTKLIASGDIQETPLQQGNEKRYMGVWEQKV